MKGFFKMIRECKRKCPLQSKGKCLSGNAHKKDFGKDCIPIIKHSLSISSMVATEF